MKELVYLYIRIGEQYWWAFLIILKSATIIQYTIKGRFMSR